MTSLSPDTLILDGEVRVYNNKLISRLEWLRARPTGEPATPPIVMAFNCLWVSGDDLRAKGLHVSRDQLEGAVAGQDVILPARRLADDGLKAWKQVVASGYEGLVAKGPALPYRASRTLWLKVKVPKYREGERGWDPRPSNRG